MENSKIKKTILCSNTQLLEDGIERDIVIGLHEYSNGMFKVVVVEEGEITTIQKFKDNRIDAEIYFLQLQTDYFGEIVQNIDEKEELS